ncbi:Peroxiredoxin-2 [Coemansia biformis]|uniref:Peroxiredoxin-2 n=1 Tax=Coemansia biformis TaxID=1286918 RepID=A0A9W8CXA0_9FUNG|nr:Peroxiredoxin-2 [Coemansia biformis]
MAPPVDDHAKRLCELSIDSEAKKRRLASATAAGEDATANCPQRKCVIGRPAPAFQVPAVLGDGTLASVSLDDYRGRYVLLLFYQADFTFVCQTELSSFSDRARELADLGCDLLVCSTDSQFVHFNWRQHPRSQGGVDSISMPMLADTTKQVSRSYGVLCEETGQAFRGLFIVDRSQLLRIALINDMPIGRSVDEALRLVQALRFTDEYGEVCPAGWRPGSAAIKPSIHESKRFFGQHVDQDTPMI